MRRRWFLSGPYAFSIRRAISGVSAALPRRRSESVARLQPKDRMDRSFYPETKTHSQPVPNEQLGAEEGIRVRNTNEFFPNALDISSIGCYYLFMATSISDSATFLRVVVRKDFLKTIQDYRFTHRHNSASDAIRALIGYGLLAEGVVTPADGVSAVPPFRGAAPEIVNGSLVGWSGSL